MIYDVHGDPLGTASGNVLYGKKYVACGDSFTAGDATGYTARTRIFTTRS